MYATRCESVRSEEEERGSISVVTRHLFRAHKHVHPFDAAHPSLGPLDLLIRRLLSLSISPVFLVVLAFHSLRGQHLVVDSLVYTLTCVPVFQSRHDRRDRHTTKVSFVLIDRCDIDRKLMISSLLFSFSFSLHLPLSRKSFIFHFLFSVFA